MLLFLLLSFCVRPGPILGFLVVRVPFLGELHEGFARRRLLDAHVRGRALYLQQQRRVLKNFSDVALAERILARSRAILKPLSAICSVVST